MIEIILASVSIVIVIGVFLAVVMGGGAPQQGRIKQLKDAAQIKQIHGAWVMWSSELEGRMPTPGLVRPMPDPVIGVVVPGRGEEDLAANDHGKLYSASIMHNYFQPQVCISPVEVNAAVSITPETSPKGYDWDVYDPASGVYWDDRFSCRLPGSSVSYATVPLVGDRRQTHWTASGSPELVVLGNRGPRGYADAAQSRMSERSSVTVGFHEPADTWSGNICHADNHMSFVESIWPGDPTYSCTEGGAVTPDSLFYNDCGGSLDSMAGHDNYLSLIWRLTELESPSDKRLFRLDTTWD